MKLILLGCGEIGNYLSRNLSLSHNINIFSLQNSKFLSLKNLIRDSPTKFNVIDLMDPNSINIDTRESLLIKAKEIRTIFCNSDLINQYIYLSSSNIYKSSKEMIFEDSLIKTEGLTEYLKLKINSENFLNEFSMPLSICRIPSVWGQDSNKNSFFSDLREAFNSNKFIHYRSNDKEVISYININDLANLLGHILDNKLTGVINVSTDSYNTRFNLKAKINDKETSSIEDCIGIRLSSKRILWKKYINKTCLPF